MWRGLWAQGTVVLCMVGLCLVVSRWEHVGRYQPLGVGGASVVQSAVVPNPGCAEDDPCWECSVDGNGLCGRITGGYYVRLLAYGWSAAPVGRIPVG